MNKRRHPEQSKDAQVELVWPGKSAGMPGPAALRVVERVPGAPVEHGALRVWRRSADDSQHSPGWTNWLVHGDNLPVMGALAGELGGAIDLIYADPPFATGAGFRLRGSVNGRRPDALAFRDVWSGGIASYLQMLYPRLALMHRLLSDRGSVYLHVDWRAAHYAQALLDEIFGREHFRNAIAWHYGGRGAKAVSGQYPRNHDVILYYAKTRHAPFHRPVRTLRLGIEDARRRGYRQDADGRWFKTAPRGDYTDASVRRLHAEGRIHRTRSGTVRVKYFTDEADGQVLDRQPVGDVWDDIPDMMHAPPGERTGYPTQKPEALLARIVEASSQPGGLVADFFCGSGVTLVMAERLGRRWLGCDASPAAIEVTRRRLLGLPRHAPFHVLRAESQER